MEANQQRSRLAELASQTQQQQLQLQQQQAQRMAAKDQRELSEAERQRLIETAPAVNQALKDVTDQAGYEIARASLRQFGIDDLPDFSPEGLANIKQGAAALVGAATEQAAAKRGDTGYTLTPGARRYDAQGNLIAEVPAADKNEPLVEIYDPSSPTGTKMVPRGQAAGQPGKPAQSMLQITGYDEQGRPMIQVGGTGAGGKLTEQQSKDVGYYQRGIDAAATLSQFENELTNFSQAKLAELAPLGLGNYARSPEFRQAKQAADSFLTSILRKDTGAAITNQEFDIYGPMFLPQPGDDPATLSQKRRARVVAMDAIRSSLGTAEAVAKANEAKIGLTSPQPGINPAVDISPAPLPARADDASLRQRAQAAIQSGKDEAAVRARFREITGKDL